MIKQNIFKSSNTFAEEWIKLHTDEDLEINMTKNIESFTLLSVVDSANFHIQIKINEKITSQIWKFKRGSKVRLVGANTIDYNEYDILDIVDGVNSPPPE